MAFFRFFRRSQAVLALVALPIVGAVTAPTPLAQAATLTSSSADLAVGFAEASQQPGTWSASAGYQLAVNWDGSVGARPLAIAYGLVNLGTTTVTGPTLTNASAQSASGGSVLVLRGSSLALDGATSATRVAGTQTGGSATVPTPTGMRPGDLVAVYINSGTTMVAPTGWTLRHQDGQGSVWTQAFATVPGSLGTWTTAGSSGWTYTAVAFSGSGSSPLVVAAGGAGAQSSAVVQTGSVTPPPAPTSTSTTSTATPVATTSTTTSTASTSFVTGLTSHGTLRSDYTGSLGMKITVGSTPLTITELGRYVESGNKQAHSLSLIRASDGAQVASTTLNLATATKDAAGFAYAPLATPVILNAGGVYYIVSSETIGGDTFEGGATFPTLAHSSVATIQGGVWKNGTSWALVGTGAYVPTTFRYQTGTTTSTAPAATATPVAATATPVSPTPTTVSVSGGTFSANDPWGEDRCHNSALPSVNVRTDFGAHGDGTTDDRAAFVNAIATGKVVKVPAGTYVLSQVNLSANQVVVLCGAGQGTTTLIQAPSPTQTEAMFSQYDYAGKGHLAYLELQNLTLDGNAHNVLRRPQGSSMMNYGIVTAMVRKMLVANTEIRNGYHGLRLLNVGDQLNGTPGEAIIRDNWFHSMALEAGYTGGTTHNIYVAKEWPSQSVIWVDRNNIEECGSGTGATCTLPSATPGQSAGGLLYSPDGYAAGGPPQQVFRIKDNTFRNLGMNMVGTEEPEAEIYLYQQADNSKIIHNSFINSYYEGVAVFSSNNVEIAYNVADGNGVPVSPSSGYDHMEYYAIDALSRKTYFPTYINSSGWNIHDNVVQNSTWYKTGICACFVVDAAGNGTASNITITNNKFVNNLDKFDNRHTTPISTLNAVNVTMSGNDTAQN